MRTAKKNAAIKKYSVQEFERIFPDMTTQVREKMEPFFDKTIYPNLKIIVCKMKVKGGKRGIVEYLTQKSKNSTQPISNMFITAWNRKADISQREELKAYGIQVHIPSSKKNVDKIINDIKKINVEKRIHLDELDFGSSDSGLLAQVFARFKEDAKSTWILYSATPEELTCCEKWIDLEASGEAMFVEIDPPAEYMGIKEYIDRSLMVESNSMFDFDNEELSQHGKDVLETAARKYLQDRHTNRKHIRNISIMRINGKHNNISRFNWVVGNKHLMQDHLDSVFGNGIVRLYVKDIGCKSAHTASWDNYESWEAEHSNERFFVYIVEQSACRATEFRCHHKLSFYHSHRYTDEPSINTIIQDQERCVYYRLDDHHDHSVRYPGYVNLEPSCIIYGDVDVAKYSAGYINLEDLLNMRKKLCPSSRTQVLRFLNKNRIKVYQAKTERELDGILATVYPDNTFTSTYSENMKSDGGFKMSKIRKISDVYSKDFVVRTNYGIKRSEIVNGRKFVCYLDTTNISTEVYVALVNDGSKYNNEVKTDSPSSMYSK